MLIYSTYHTRPLFSYFSIGNERLTTTANARSLGVVLDDSMLFDVHISDICRSSFNRIRNLSKIGKYLTLGIVKAEGNNVNLATLQRNFLLTVV